MRCRIGQAGRSSRQHQHSLLAGRSTVRTRPRPGRNRDSGVDVADPAPRVHALGVEVVQSMAHQANLWRSHRSRSPAASSKLCLGAVSFRACGCTPPFSNVDPRSPSTSNTLLWSGRGQHDIARSPSAPAACGTRHDARRGRGIHGGKHTDQTRSSAPVIRQTPEERACPPLAGAVGIRSASARRAPRLGDPSARSAGSSLLVANESETLSSARCRISMEDAGERCVRRVRPTGRMFSATA